MAWRHPFEQTNVDLSGLSAATCDARESSEK